VTTIEVVPAEVAASLTYHRIGSVALSIPAALTMLFLLFSGLLYFQYAEHAVPVAGTISAWLPFSNQKVATIVLCSMRS